MTERGVDEEALAWAIRLSEPEADWDAFLAWIERDPVRAERYERASAALAEAAEAVAARPPRPAEAPPLPAGDASEPRRRRWLAGALAAALTGAIGIGVWTQRPRPYVVSTPDGERRTVSLPDGSSVVLAGGSSVRLDRRDPRVATALAGEMLFRIRHDRERPFAVTAGTLTLLDLGTVFDVRRSGAQVRVEVADGAVMVDPHGAALRLDPGQSVTLEGAVLQRGEIDRSEVGDWRNGRLGYQDAPLSEVAADLSRELGRPVIAGRDVAVRRFRGTLDLATVRAHPETLGNLLDVAVRRDEGGWTLEPRR